LYQALYRACLKVLLSQLFGNVFELKNNGVRTILKEHDMDILISIISLCDAAGLSEQESMDLINKGALGYKKINRVKSEKVREPTPVEISRATYYKYKKIVHSHEFQRKYLYEHASVGFMESVYQIKLILKFLKRLSIKNLMTEQDPVKNQQIINAITRNMVYQADFDETLKLMIEHQKIPTLEDLDPKNNKDSNETS